MAINNIDHSKTKTASHSEGWMMLATRKPNSPHLPCAGL